MVNLCEKIRHFFYSKKYFDIRFTAKNKQTMTFKITKKVAYS